MSLSLTKTVRVRYVGLKPSETDHLYGTDIVWNGAGDIKTVPTDAWAKMAKHVDVWELAGDDDLSPPAPPDESPPPPGFDPEVDFEAMTDEQVHAFAKAAGLHLHNRLQGANLRAKLADALAMKQGEG
jgi:hypothetical protein